MAAFRSCTKHAARMALQFHRFQQAMTRKVLFPAKGIGREPMVELWP
jgi:hypothetical protein